MYINLSGLTILVTGASKGIGKAIATRLAEAGATVAIHYNTNLNKAEMLAQSVGNESKAFQADFSKPEEVIKLFNKVIEEYDTIDVLVNNAGIAISTEFNIGEKEWLADWTQTMMVNLNATGLLCKKAIEHFQKNRNGRVINITSRAAFRGDTPEYMAYAASKGGVVALTRSIARAYGKDGIKAFNIAPGFTRTDMAEEFIKAYGEERAMQDIALDKLTEPKDIAPMVTFLASGMADHATGCTIDINAASYVH